MDALNWGWASALSVPLKILLTTIIVLVAGFFVLQIWWKPSESEQRSQPLKAERAEPSENSVTTPRPTAERSSFIIQHTFPTSSRDAKVFPHEVGRTARAVFGTSGNPAISSGTDGSATEIRTNTQYMRAVPLTFDTAFETNQTIDVAFRNVSRSFTAYNIGWLSYSVPFQ